MDHRHATWAWNDPCQNPRALPQCSSSPGRAQRQWRDNRLRIFPENMGKFKGTMAQHPMKHSLTLICLHSFCISCSMVLCLSDNTCGGPKQNIQQRFGSLFGHLGKVRNHPKVIRIYGPKTSLEHPKTANFLIFQVLLYFVFQIESLQVT